MKLLKSEQQAELIECLYDIRETNAVTLSLEQMAQLNYWIIELRPKRVMKKKPVDNVVIV